MEYTIFYNNKKYIIIDSNVYECVLTVSNGGVVYQRINIVYQPLKKDIMAMFELEQAMKKLNF